MHHPKAGALQLFRGRRRNQQIDKWIAHPLARGKAGRNDSFVCFEMAPVAGGQPIKAEMTAGIRKLCIQSKSARHVLGSCGIVLQSREQRGAIENSRGMIKIIDRKRLEEASCECYNVIQNFNGGLGLK